MTDREILEKILVRLDNMDKRLDNLENDVKSIKVTLENDIEPTTKLTLDILVDHSKRFIKPEKELQELSDNAVINDVLEEIKSMKTM